MVNVREIDKTMEGGKMKRIASAVSAILAVVLVSSVTFGQVSVPNLVNFQGRLLNNLGSPVADGSYGVTFRLFDASVAGALVWAETSLVNTSGGVFTHQLGSDNPFDVTLFQDYDSLFLEIVVGGETITPRSRLTSAPYTRLAGGIEVPGNFNDPETLSIGTNQFHVHSIKTFGSDGQEQFRVWGDGWGEIYLYDQSVSNDRTVVLSATGNAGGQLSLNQEDGTSGMFLRGGTTSAGATLTMRDFDGIATISLDADAIGNAAALLPTSSVSAVEMYDEPGIAHEFNSGLVALTTTTTAYDTVSITAPNAGYIIVIAHASFFVDHTNGAEDLVRMSISSTSGSIDFNNSALWRGNTQNPTNTGADEYLTLSCTKVEAVTAGSHTYFLNSDQFSGSGGSILRRHMTAMFFPTAYGTVVSTIASKPGPTETASIPATDPTGVSWQSEVKTITVEEHNARLQAELEAMRAELEARILKLEKQFNQTGPSQGVDQYE